MTWVAVAVAGSAVVGAGVGISASKRAERAQERAGGAAISAQERALQSFEQRTQPFADVGLSAAPELQRLLGLSVSDPQVSGLQTQLQDIDARIAAGAPTTTGGGLLSRVAGQAVAGAPGAFNLEELTAQRADISSQLEAAQAAGPTSPLRDLGAPQQLEEINPLVSFLRDEGFQDIQESAAARGRLGAGGTLKDLTRFNTQLASTVAPQLQQQRFNQLFSVLGLGANVSAGQGTAGLQTAGNVGNLLGNIGQAQAAGAQQRGGTQQQLASNLTGALGFGLAQNTPVQQPQVGGIQNPNQFEAFT